MFIGNSIQAELDDIPLGKGKKAAESRAAKQQRRLEQLLGIHKKSTKGRFRDPASMFS